MRLTEILKDTESKRVPPSADPEVVGLTDDSRSVKKGDMFVAFKGYAQDGYGFIDKAITNGAGVVVSEKDFAAPVGVVKVMVEDTRTTLPLMADNFYSHPSEKLKMIGVTGTNGKTTITYIIESMLKAAGEGAGVIGTISHKLGKKIVPAKNTTPGPIELQSMLSEMVNSSIRYSVMEVSSHALDQHRVDAIYYDEAIFTNITPEHLDYHNTMDEYFKAKVKIFGRLKKNGVAILNNDDPRVSVLKDSIKGKVVTYGVKTTADVRAGNIRLSLDYSSFSIVTPKWSVDVTTRLIGSHNVSNILAAVSACSCLGIPPAAIKSGIEAVRPVPGRLETIECGQPFKVFVDFAHTEDALEKVLSLLREVSKERIITVFGCGGNRDKKKRPLMGSVACRLSDHVVITSDNPRFEGPADIIDEITSGVRGKFSNYITEIDRRKAIEKALSLAGVGSIVVIAGKGHENCQIIKEKALPFDDREVARGILQAVSGKKR